MAATENTPSDRPQSRPGRSLYLVLAGLVTAGVVGWWRWLRSVRKY